MQTAPQVVLSDTASPDIETQPGEFAQRLAKTHIVEISYSKKKYLLEDLKSWELALRNANTIFKSVPANDLPVSRAGEWMLDNFYVVKQTFRQIEEDLPASFLNQLPKLKATPLQGYPRIFALAWEWGFWSGLSMLLLN
mgnify:CR=1 FL=1